MRARAAACGSPSGGGISATIRSSSSATPAPVLAETRATSLGSHPMMCASSAAYLSG